MFSLLLSALLLTLPSFAFAMKAEFDYSIHLSVCGRGISEFFDGEACVGDVGLAKGTRQVTLEESGCVGNDETCKEMKIFGGEYEENFRLTRPEVREAYEVTLTVRPGAFSSKDSVEYNLETHLAPVNGSESDDRNGYVSLTDPAGFRSMQVGGVQRAMLGTNGDAVKVSPYVFVSKLRFLRD